MVEEDDSVSENGDTGDSELNESRFASENDIEGDLQRAANTVVRFGIPFESAQDDEGAVELLEEGISASEILDAIGDAVDEVGIIRDLAASTELFRGRVGTVNKPFKTARQLGPPPPKKATANRMSPAGISMFYGAFDEITAIEETIQGTLGKREIVNVGVRDHLSKRQDAGRHSMRIVC